MANRTFLSQADTPDTVRREMEPAGVIAAGSNCIPLYWYSLFESNCLVSNEVTLSDGRVMVYPHLVTSTAQARKRCLVRRNILERLTPEAHATLLGQWLTFLDAVELPFLHLDASELWMMLDEDDFQSELQNRLRIFDSPLPPQGPLWNNPLWLEMLDSVQIDPDDLPGTFRAFKLAGYAWGRPVPWAT